MKKILIVSVILMALVLGSAFANTSNVTVGTEVRYFPNEWSNIGEGIAFFGPDVSFSYIQDFAASSFAAYSSARLFYSPWVWQTGTKTIETKNESFFGVRGLFGVCLKPAENASFKFVPAVGLYYELTDTVFTQATSGQNGYIIDHSVGVGANIDMMIALSRNISFKIGLGSHYQLFESTRGDIDGTSFSEKMTWAPTIDSLDAQIGIGFSF